MEGSGEGVVLTEIKATTTYRNRLNANLDKVAGLVDGPVQRRVVYAGEERVVDGVEVVGWGEIN